MLVLLIQEKCGGYFYCFFKIHMGQNSAEGKLLEGLQRTRLDFLRRLRTSRSQNDSALFLKRYKLYTFLRYSMTLLVCELCFPLNNVADSILLLFSWYLKFKRACTSMIITPLTIRPNNRKSYMLAAEKKPHLL